MSTIMLKHSIHKCTFLYKISQYRKKKINGHHTQAPNRTFQLKFYFHVPPDLINFYFKINFVHSKSYINLYSSLLKIFYYLERCAGAVRVGVGRKLVLHICNLPTRMLTHSTTYICINLFEIEF